MLKIQLAEYPEVKFLVDERYKWRHYTVETDDVDITFAAELTSEASNTEEFVATVSLKGNQLTRLASKTNNLVLLARLFQVAYVYASKVKGYKSFKIEVNPRHTRFYEWMGFEPQDEYYHAVGAPAVMLTLDFEKAETMRGTGFYKLFFPIELEDVILCGLLK